MLSAEPHASFPVPLPCCSNAAALIWRQNHTRTRSKQARELNLLPKPSGKDWQLRPSAPLSWLCPAASKIRLQSQQIQQESAVHVIAWTKGTNRADYVRGFFQLFKCFWNGKETRASNWSAPWVGWSWRPGLPTLVSAWKWHGLFDFFKLFFFNLLGLGFFFVNIKVPFET